MNIKQALTGLALIVATTGALQAKEPNKEQQTANGTLIAAPETFDVKSFAHVQIYAGNDTIDIYTGPVGLGTYTLPADSTQEYAVYVQPGYVDQEFGHQFKQGDQFEPYYARLKVEPGNNDLQELKRDRLLTDAYKGQDYALTSKE